MALTAAKEPQQCKGEVQENEHCQYQQKIPQQIAEAARKHSQGFQGGAVGGPPEKHVIGAQKKIQEAHGDGYPQKEQKGWTYSPEPGAAAAKDHRHERKQYQQRMIKKTVEGLEVQQGEFGPVGEQQSTQGPRQYHAV